MKEQVSYGKTYNVDPYDLPSEVGGLFLECVQEGIHQGMDGWSESEQSVIMRYLEDITLGVRIHGRFKEVVEGK